MTTFPNDLNKKSDDELIAIVNGKIPNKWGQVLQ
jgi:hypothetical protein